MMVKMMATVTNLKLVKALELINRFFWILSLLFSRLLMFSYLMMTMQPLSNSAESSESPFEAFITSVQTHPRYNYSSINDLFATARDSCETCAMEIKAFIGITILIGYHRLPSMRDYWSRDVDLSVPFVVSIMSRERLEIIRKVLHFNDNTQNHLQEDRANNVRPLIQHFNEAFHSAMFAINRRTHGNVQRPQCNEAVCEFKTHPLGIQVVDERVLKNGLRLRV